MAEEKKIKRIGVLTSGGDAPGMNAAVRALDEGRKNIIVGTKEGSLMEIPIEEALNMKKELQMDRYHVLETMSISVVSMPQRIHQ